MAKFEKVDIRDALYKGTNIDEIKELHIQSLRSEGSKESLLYADKLEEANDILNISTLHQLEHEFHDLKEHLRLWAKAHNVHLYIVCRQKDWIGYNEKIQLFITQNMPLAKILDLLGFRIILGTSLIDSLEEIKLCYELQNEVMAFLINKKNCVFLEAEPRIDAEFKASDFPEIIIPEENYLCEEWSHFVKDYIYNPKYNGYQSLHSVVMTPNNCIFELQIRTYAMDIKALHKDYKKNRYKNLDNLCIDYDKINIPGFSVSNGNIIDIVGLRKSVDPFNAL